MRTFYQKALAMSAHPTVVRASLNTRKESTGKEDSEQAALAAVGSLLFNLDAALTR
jgi:hypothetical protein